MNFTTLPIKSDVRKMDPSRLTSAVVIHAAAFLVAVVCLGSGSGLGSSAVADSKIDRIGRKQPVQAVGVESRSIGQTIGARELPGIFAGEGVIAVQYQPAPGSASERESRE